MGTFFFSKPGNIYSTTRQAKRFAWITLAYSCRPRGRSLFRLVLPLLMNIQEEQGSANQHKPPTMMDLKPFMSLAMQGTPYQKLSNQKEPSYFPL